MSNHNSQLLENFQEYFGEIKKNYQQGDYTEMTFRTALENFIEKLHPDYELYEEPGRKKKLGAPDFIARRKSVKIGYYETKNIGDDLNIENHGEQLGKYKQSIGNIIFTNYLHFILLRDGTKIFEIDLLNKSDLDKSKLKFTQEKINDFCKMNEIFFGYNRSTIISAEELAKELAKRAKLLREISKEQLILDKNAKGDQELSTIFYFYEGIKELINDITIEDCADAYAQTVTYGLFLSKMKIKKGILELESASQFIPQSIMIIKKIFRNITEGIPFEISWILAEIIEILNSSDIEKVMNTIDKRKLRDRDPFSFFYEDFLEKYDPDKRKSLGVYFTPRPVVFFIVNSINLILKNDFNKLNGYADDDVTVLDPATGTATFLWAIYFSTILELKWKNLSGLINKKIETHVLKDFYGFEIQIAAYIFAHLKLSATLTESQYVLKEKDRTGIYLTNTLEPAETHGLIAFMKELNEESHVANLIKNEKNVLVILSNPPYKSISINNSKWIQDLLKKGYTTKTGHKDTGYYTVDGEPLDEKNPKWLQDDYVKFIRFAQWKIDSAGEGVVGYITNHSYLENFTFRGMRQSLMNSFDRIYILNLHGDMRKKESSPDGGKDENVFESITQGVAISIFVKSKKFKDKKIYYSDLWGKRSAKFDWLDRHNAVYSETEKTIGMNVDWTEIHPISPNYFFLPKDYSLLEEYEKFWKVTDIFQMNLTVIITARDNLTIKWSEDEIFQTVTKLVGLDPDSAKEEFNLKDSEDWKVERALTDLRNSGPEKEFVTPILYRPFDVRYTYYTGNSRGFIGRPKAEIMQHMLQKNVGLITRKQMQSPFNFVFITNQIVSDGVIRSDNKGAESLFPLYLYNDNEEKKSNINSNVVKHLSELYKKNISPENIFYYVYAILYSLKYRKKYSEFLKNDFPKIPFVKNFSLFKKLCELGEELTNLHLSQFKIQPNTKFDISGSNKVSKITYVDEKIYINDTQCFDGISKPIWNFSIGAHQVLDKWLKSRKTRVLDNSEIEKFLQIIEIIKKTITCMNEIDKIQFLPNEIKK